MITVVEGKKLHEFINEKRRAEVYSHKNGYIVRMFDDKLWIEDRFIENHSERYAEDCAENFVMGLIHA